MESINKLVKQAIPAPSNYLSNIGEQGEKRKFSNFRSSKTSISVLFCNIL